MMKDDTCVCCGAYVPEGRQVCHKCTGEDKQAQISKDEEEMLLCAYDMIEDMFPDAAKIELFARNERDEWDCWGNEVPTT